MNEYEKLFYCKSVLNEMKRCQKKKNDSIFELSDFDLTKMNLSNAAFSTFSMRRMKEIMLLLDAMQKSWYQNMGKRPSYREMTWETTSRIEEIIRKGR